MRSREHSCAWCGGTQTLTVHHVRPRFAGGLDQHSNRVTLCLACHALTERWSFDNLSKAQPAIGEGMRRAAAALAPGAEPRQTAERRAALGQLLQTGWRLLSTTKVDWSSQLQVFEKRRATLETLEPAPDSRQWIAASPWWVDG